MKNIDQQKEEQLKIGLSALSKCIKTKADSPNAFLRIDFGYITLKYGIPGDPKRKFKTGRGISHIIAKRNSENNDGLPVAKKIIEVLVYGEVEKINKEKNTVNIVMDGYRAVLALDWYGESLTWLLSGFKIENEP